MPEEINRVLTDSIADLLLTPSIDGNMNLIKKGIAEEKIRFVGNIMIDTLFNMRKRSGESTILSDLEITEKGYALVTLHRPSNVDRENTLSSFVDILEQTSEDHLPLVWPVHPRSKNRAEQFGLWDPGNNQLLFDTEEKDKRCTQCLLYVCCVRNNSESSGFCFNEKLSLYYNE